MRKRSQAAVFDPASWEEVDAAIRRMGEIDIACERINGEAVLKINDIKQEAKQRTAGLAAERRALEKAVETFCAARKSEFAKKRSKTLTFGAIGYRIVTKVPLPKDKGKVAALVSALKAFDLLDCIKIKEAPDRERIAELDEATIAKLGLSRTVKDSFRIVPDIEAIQNSCDAA